MRFITESGIEAAAVTAEQMREIDRIAVQETGPNLYQMMENAGRNLASLAMELLGSEWQRANIVVLAGTGGNAGGGICAARHLVNHGAQVRLSPADPQKLSEVSAFQRRIYQFANGKELSIEELHEARVDLIIDALIGYGLDSAPSGPFRDLICWANASAAPILALDVPSGIDATTGEALGESIRAKWTLTLALPKTGLLTDRTGTLFLADIGIPAETYSRAGLSYINPFADRFWIPLQARQSHPT